MLRKFSDYTNVFFWSFKRMDNANYNFQIVEILCGAKKRNSNNLLFNKPIIVLIVSIIECVLYDFIQRVNEHSAETIPNLEEAIVLDTKAKILDQLEPLIAHVQKNNLLRTTPGDNIYSDLDHLRQVRNRIHIQNAQQQLDKDEYNVFTNENLRIAGETLERVCEVLCHVYPRPNRDFVPMSDFPHPWL